MFSRFDNEEVENYFNALNAQLQRMPRADRALLHEELRQHLDGLVAAHEELGASFQEATEAAVRQMGSPVKTGRKLFQEWRLTRKAGKHAIDWEIVCATALLLGLYAGGGYIQEPSIVPDWVRTVSLFAYPPLIAGGMVGIFRPKNALRNMARASLLLCALDLVISLPTLSCDLTYVGIQSAYGIQATASGSHWMDHLCLDSASVARGTAWMIFGLLPGCLGAVITTALRRGVDKVRTVAS